MPVAHVPVIPIASEYHFCLLSLCISLLLCYIRKQVHAEFSEDLHSLVFDSNKQTKKDKNAFHRDVGIMVATAEFFYYYFKGC